MKDGKNPQLRGRLRRSARSGKYNECGYSNSEKGLPPKDVAELCKYDEKAW